MTTQLPHCAEHVRTLPPWRGHPSAAPTVAGNDLQTLFEAFIEMPLYIMDHSIDELFRSGQAQRSVSEMFKADVAKLPFPELLVECWDGSRVRHFVSLKQLDDDPQFFYAVITWEGGPNGGIWMEQCAAGGISWRPELEVEGHLGVWELRSEGMRGATPDAKDKDYVQRVAAFALNFALLMSHVAGLEREVIETPPKLHKARVRSGKPSVAKYHLVRIGHVYDKAGNKVAITEGNRRTMPVHMRSGHIRNQPYGPGRELRKPIWIAPVLVNYEDGSPLPLPKPKVVRL